jgi:replicative DNA helicase
VTAPRRDAGSAPSRGPLVNREAEEAVLGACLLSRHAIGAALGVGLEAADFAVPSHGVIYGAITALYLDGQPVDSVIVGEALRQAGTLEEVGGPARLVELTGSAPSSTAASAEVYARAVAEVARERRLAGALLEAQDVLRQPGSPEAKRARVAALLGDLLAPPPSGGPETLGDWVTLVLDEAEQGPPRRIPTGLADLDELLGGGLRPGELTLVGGRPGMGKSAFGLNLALGAARAGSPVLFVSVEMTGREQARRAIAASPRSVRLEDLDHVHEAPRIAEAAWQAATSLLGLPFILTDRDRTAEQVVAHARRLKARPEGLDLVVVDYLGILETPQGERREREVAVLSRAMARLAKELDVAVVALSQLNRELERRADKRPILADLRDSGSLEQDADVVLFLYRDEEYDHESADAGTAEVILAKGRNIRTGTVRLAWQGERTRFASLARPLRAVPGGQR